MSSAHDGLSSDDKEALAIGHTIRGMALNLCLGNIKDPNGEALTMGALPMHITSMDAVRQIYSVVATHPEIVSQFNQGMNVMLEKLGIDQRKDF